MGAHLSTTAPSNSSPVAAGAQKGEVRRTAGKLFTLPFRNRFRLSAVRAKPAEGKEEKKEEEAWRRRLHRIRAILCTTATAKRYSTQSAVMYKFIIARVQWVVKCLPPFAFLFTQD